MDRTQERAVRVLVVIVLLAAAVMLWSPRERWSGIDARKALLLVAASAIVACRPVRISRLRIELVPFHPFILIALAVCGTRAAALTAVAGLLAAALARNPRPPVIRLLFNLGSIIVATLTAGIVFLSLGGIPRAELSRLVWPLMGAAFTFFVVSTGLVGGAISLEKDQGFFATWRRSLAWTFWPNVAGASIAIAGVGLFHESQLAALLVTTAPCWLLVLFYRAEALRLNGGLASGVTP